ncbi:MAG: UDP-N-acetylmuramate dehydrogenase [Acidobacteria bacterium]|nr:UDP-N-acetylmuramate dehydrogenase [Acidobacteriota bacterium]
MNTLERIPGLTVRRAEPLARHTRFGFGGPAALFAEARDAGAFIRAFEAARDGGLECVVIGGGTNLVASDAGFPGLVLRFAGAAISAQGSIVRVEAGAALADLVDFAIERGLGGLETLAGIPGSTGAAIYGNAGAYGHSISERVRRVRFFDGAAMSDLDAAGCEFQYRESVFKRRKDWIVFEAELALTPGSRDELHAAASGIVQTRNRKFPPEMKCAGSVFKNLLREELPETAAREVPGEAVREGKVPAAWFLERVGAKGMAAGGIRVAGYHANLIYNSGGGTAREFRELVSELKERVRARFGLELEEEVQYLGG